MAQKSETRFNTGQAEKTCTKCGQWRLANFDNFALFKQGVMGLHPWCRDCHRENLRAKAAKSGNPVRKILAPAGALPKAQKPIPANISQLLESITRDLDERGRYKAYLITNQLTGEPYVGITERKLRDRWKQHLVGGTTGTGYLLHKVMQRDGIENFTFEFIACTIDRHNLHLLEVQLIEQYRSVELGYNQTRGGAAGEAVGTEITVGGRTFISISSAAREFGVDEATAFQRLNRYGWTVEQAVGVAPAPERKGRITNYEFEGQTFATFVAACSEFGLDDSLVRRRLGSGWTQRQAFGLDPAPAKARRGKSIEIGGQQFESVSLASQQFGVRSNTALKRIANGQTREQAFGIEPAPPTEWAGRPIVINGSVFRSVVAAAKAFGIDPRLASAHLRNGWTTEQVFGIEAPKPRSEVTNGLAITLNGVKYQSRAKAAAALGISPKIVHKRLTQFGWTLEQAFGLDAPPIRRSNSSKAVTILGITYPTIADACKAFGITQSAVNRRISLGMQLEEAIAKPSQKSRPS